MGSATIQGDLWGQVPLDWAELAEPLSAPLWEAVLEATGVGRGTRLLDVGCGAGGLASRAARTGAEVSGLDAVPAFLEIAKSAVPNGVFRVGDIEELPFADATFDAVVATNSVQYAAEPVNALREIKRVCRPGGRIAIAVWGQAEHCEMRHVFQAVVEAMPDPPKGGGPFALSGPGALEALLAQAGIVTDDRTELPCPWDFTDIEAFWRSLASSGPLQGAMRAAGKQAIKDAVVRAARQFVTDGGGVHIDNTMVFVTATA